MSCVETANHAWRNQVIRRMLLYRKRLNLLLMNRPLVRIELLRAHTEGSLVVLLITRLPKISRTAR